MRVSPVFCRTTPQCRFRLSIALVAARATTTDLLWAQHTRTPLVAGIEDLREKREGILKAINDEEAEKMKVCVVCWQAAGLW